MPDELIMKALEQHYVMLVSLRNRRADAVQVLTDIDDEIAKITPKIIGLAALVDDVPESSDLGQFLLETASTGITDAVRSVMRSAGPAVRLKPTNIRDHLVKMGVSLDYKNPLAVIGSTLKRLEESGEIRRATQGGTTLYSWVRASVTPQVELPSFEEFLKSRKPKSYLRELAEEAQIANTLNDIGSGKKKV